MLLTLDISREEGSLRWQKVLLNKEIWNEPM